MAIRASKAYQTLTVDRVSVDRLEKDIDTKLGTKDWIESNNAATEPNQLDLSLPMSGKLSEANFKELQERYEDWQITVERDEPHGKFTLRLVSLDTTEPETEYPSSGGSSEELEARVKKTDLAADTGAALVGTSDGRTLQQHLDEAIPSSEELEQAVAKAQEHREAADAYARSAGTALQANQQTTAQGQQILEAVSSSLQTVNQLNQSSQQAAVTALEQANLAGQANAASQALRSSVSTMLDAWLAGQLKGDKGEAFEVDAQGPFDQRVNYDSAVPGFSYLDVEAGQLFFRLDAGGWSAGVPFGKGDKGDRGLRGETGYFKIDAQGLLTSRDLYDEEDPYFTFFDTANRHIYFRTEEPGWSDPIPFGRGDKGDKGENFKIDARGPFSDRELYDSEVENFNFLDIEAGYLYTREGTEGNWSAATPFGKGEKGDRGDRGEGFRLDAWGSLEERDLYDEEPLDFTYLDEDEGYLYIRVAVNIWSDPIPFGKGARGEKGDPFLVESRGLRVNRSLYDEAPPLFAFLAIDEGLLYFRLEAGGWTEGIAFGKGDKGDKGNKGDRGAPGQDAVVPPLEWANVEDRPEFADEETALAGESLDTLMSPALVAAVAKAIAARAMPLAAVCGFYRTTAPEGWLVADGSEFDIEEYPELAHELGDIAGTPSAPGKCKTPDLRGVFLRGLDLGRGRDTNRVLGTLQQSQNQAHVHSHSLSATSAGAHTHSVSSPLQGHGQGTQGVNLNSITLNQTATVVNPTVRVPIGGGQANSDGTHSHPIGGGIGTNGGNEARPINVAVLNCIKT